MNRIHRIDPKPLLVFIVNAPFRLDVESVLCDFELNIMKSIDMMLQCPILCCFFHHKNCIQRRVDRNGFKMMYQNDEHFKSFINQCSSLSQLPIEDVQEGLDDIRERFNFSDERNSEFKDDLLDYMEIQGVSKKSLHLSFGYFSAFKAPT